jgi:hypothetical protein
MRLLIALVFAWLLMPFVLVMALVHWAINDDSLVDTLGLYAGLWLVVSMEVGGGNARLHCE